MLTGPNYMSLLDFFLLHPLLNQIITPGVCFSFPFGFLFGTAEQGILLILALVLMLLRHRDGLARVMQGKEQKKLRRKHRSPDEK